MATFLGRLIRGQRCGHLLLPNRNIINGLYRCSSATSALPTPSSTIEDDVTKCDPEVPVDPTVTAAKFKDKLCSTPREAETNLLTFLNRSDVIKRQRNIEVPYFRAGSYLKVTYADSGAHSGVNQFTGICIAKNNRGIGSNFILRNVISGIGIERLFDMYSPHVQKIEASVAFINVL